MGGILLFLPSTGDIGPAFGVLAAGATAGLVVGWNVGRKLQFSSGDQPLTAVLGAEGVLVGAFAPGIFRAETEDLDIVGGMLVGGAVGVLTGAVLSQYTSLTPGEVGVGFGAGVFAGVGGFGLGLLSGPGTSLPSIDKHARFSARLQPGHIGAIVGSLAGIVIGTAVAPQAHFSPGDGALITLSSSWGLWQGLGLSVGLGLKDTTLSGGVLLGFGGGGIAGMLLSQALELSPATVAAASTGILWGTWFAAFGANLVEGLTFRPAMLVVVAGGDAGLALTSILLSPLVGARPAQLGVASLGGIAGAAAFTLGTALATNDGNALIVANLTGTAVGLVTGGVIASVFDIGVDPEPAAPGRSVEHGSWSDGVRFRGLSSTPIYDGRGQVSGFSAGICLVTP